jgi:predicted PurR-regulated permease PerM
MAGVVFGLLLGFVGLILATPLMVVVMVLVRELYVERFLEGRGSG